MSVHGRDVVCDGIARGVSVRVVETDGDTNDGDEELADEHTEGTPNEERSTTESFDGVEGDGGGADVDEGEDQGDQEGVRDGAG